MVPSEALAEEGGFESIQHKAVPSYGWQAMFYAYILQSIETPDQFYRGHTRDLRQRLADHNAGRCPHTARFRPWKLKFYAAFERLELAQSFERYLKSGSGYAFAKHRFGL